MEFLTKIAVKKGTIDEIGNKLDDLKEEADRHSQQFDGSITSLKRASAHVLNLHKNIDADFEQDKIPEGMTANEVRALLKRWIERAYGVVHNLAEQAEVLKQQAIGRQAAYKTSIEFAKKMLDAEITKETQFLASQNGEILGDTTKAGRPQNRPMGVHPGSPIKKRRLQVVKDEPAKETEAEEPKVKEEPKSKAVPKKNGKEKTSTVKNDKTKPVAKKMLKKSVKSRPKAARKK